MTERGTTEIKVKTPDYHVQSRTYLNNTFAHLQRVNGEDHHVGVEIKPAVEAKMFHLMERNERITKIFQSPHYQQTDEEKGILKGPSELIITGCMDGRFDVNFIGDKTVGIYKSEAGIIGVEQRGDGKIIPKSAEIVDGVQKTARKGKILTQGTAVHTSCAAIADIQKEVRANKKYMPDVFTTIDDQYEIGKASTAENANMFIVERTTLEATNNLYNAIRTHEGFEPLARTGFIATYDLVSRGLIFAENGISISTTDLTLEHKEDIERLLGNQIGEYGVHKDDIYQPDKLLTIARKSTVITRELMYSNNQKMVNARLELQDKISQMFPQFLPEQKQAIEYFIDSIHAKQYLAQIDKNHAKLKHGEQFISSSRYQEHYAYRDTEQVLGCRVPDPETAGDLLPLKLKVMRGHMPAEEPIIYIIGSPADAMDYQQQNKGMDRSRKECLDFFKSFIRHKNVANLVRSQKLIPVPLIYDEFGGILEIPDFSYVV